MSQVSEVKPPVAAVEAVAPDTSKQGAAEKPAQKPEDSERFAQMARKEKAIRSRERDLQSREASVVAMKAELEALKTFKSRLQQDPMTVLNEAGVSYDRIMNYTPPTPQEQEMAALKAEIQALKGDTKSFQDQQAQTQKQAYEKAVAQITREVNEMVAQDDAYQTIKATKSEDAVVELIKRTYDDEGIVLDREEAARQIEDYLLEEAMSLAKLPKVQAKLAPTPAAPEAAQKSPLSQQSHTTQPKTLTHASTASVPNRMSDRERRQRAILAFQGKLS